jgi:hypothetical protein
MIAVMLPAGLVSIPSVILMTAVAPRPRSVAAAAAQEAAAAAAPVRKSHLALLRILPVPVLVVVPAALRAPRITAYLCVPQAARRLEAAAIATVAANAAAPATRPARAATAAATVGACGRRLALRAASVVFVLRLNAHLSHARK